MSAGVHSTAISDRRDAGVGDRPEVCREVWNEVCELALHTSTAARPRQHWVFATSPSPTTRPPRRSSVGWVRVVGLGVFSCLGAGGGGRL